MWRESDVVATQAQVCQFGFNGFFDGPNLVVGPQLLQPPPLGFDHTLFLIPLRKEKKIPQLHPNNRHFRLGFSHPPFNVAVQRKLHL